MPNTANISKSTWERVKTKRGFWLLPFAVSFFVMASFILVLVPQIQTINNGRRELAKEKDTLKVLVEKRQYLESIPLEQLDWQYQVASTVLPNNKPVFQTVGLLMQRTASASVSLSDYDLTPGELGTSSGTKDSSEDFSGKLAKIPVDFSAVGSFENLYSLITGFEITAPLSRVTGFDLTGFSEKVANGGEEISAKMSAEVYYAPPPGTLGKVTEPLKPLTQEQVQLINTIYEYQTLESLDNSVIPGFDEQKANPFSF